MKLKVKSSKLQTQKGAIITLVLVFGFIFLILLSGLLGFILLQYRHMSEKASWEKSLHIAEAGINFAKWRLAHAPDDFLFSGIYDFRDTAGIIIGQFQLEITAPTICDPGTRIKSTGWTSRFPEIKRTVQVLYGRLSLARYAFLINSDVWFGQGEELRGLVHSNEGIRMDGIQNSLFTSAREIYTCDPRHGCFPPQEKPGIWGAGKGGEEGLWQFPVPRKDFDAIVKDLAFLREEAMTRGIYLPPFGLGYYLNFRDNGTVDIFRIKSLKPKVWGYNGEEWVFESNDFDKIEFMINHPLPADCAPIFVEDNVWVSGVINGRTTLVAASLPEVAAARKSIIIHNNIIKANPHSVLALIAQENILIPLYSPDIMEIQAVLLAQRGSVIRYFYPFWYAPYHLRTNIKTFGSIISNDVWTFSWVDKTGEMISGFETTKMSYDHSLTYMPPPYFPTFGEYKILRWEEI